MILFRDMAGDAATNAAARVKPSQEDLAQLDHPAQDNVWHDTPNVNKDAMKGKFQGLYKGSPKEDAKAAAHTGAANAHPSGSTDPRDLAATAAHDRQTGASSGVNAQAGVSA